jgi:hypothetical protein
LQFNIAADANITPADDNRNLERLAAALEDLDAKVHTESKRLVFDFWRRHSTTSYVPRQQRAERRTRMMWSFSGRSSEKNCDSLDLSDAIMLAPIGKSACIAGIKKGLELLCPRPFLILIVEREL